MVRWFALSLLAVFTSSVARGQGTVRGHVYCGDTQQPARLAHVVLQPLVDPKSPVLQKDDGKYRSEGVFHLQTVSLDGSFVIPAVPPGLYYVIAEQEGYVSPLTLFSRQDLNHPDEAMLRRISRYMTPVSVTTGQTTQAEVRLVKGAVIEGNVHFEDGSPGVGIGMTLLQKNAKGSWESVRLNLLGGHTADHTDDRGLYRFVGVPEGEYLVRGQVELNNVITDHIFSSNGATSYGDGYHLQIYPGDTFRTRDAKPVKAAEGEHVDGVDLDIPLSRLYSLSGTVLKPGVASPANAATLTLNFADNGDELTSTAVDSNDGSFRFDFVPEGQYKLSASRIAQVQRTEVPNCNGCIPPTHTDTRTITTFGDAMLPIHLTSDQSSIVVQAKPKGAQ